MGVITPKPKKFGSDNSIDKFIHAGGEVPSEKASKAEKSELKPIKFHLPASVINEIDTLLKEISIHKPRTVWIREAILEKLNRDKKDI